MGPSEELRLAAEERARVLIDRQLDQAGWKVRDKKALNLFAVISLATLLLISSAAAIANPMV